MAEEKRRVGLTGVLALLVLLGAVGALVFLSGGDEGDSQPALERLRAEGVVRVGIANEPPYGYLDTRADRVTGEAPEIAREIFRRLGVEELDAVAVDFGALIPGLQAGRFDVIAAGMYITPERCRQVAFSEPTYRIGEAFLVREGNPEDLHSFEDVKEKDVKLGVVAGTVERQYVQKLGISEDKVVVYNENVAALEGVRSGQVAAFAGTMLTVEDLLGKTEGGELQRATPFEQPVIDGETVWGYGAFAFRKGDEELLEAFNRELEGFLGTPEHLELVRPFGFGEETLPGDVTTAELCDER